MQAIAFINYDTIKTYVKKEGSKEEEKGWSDETFRFLNKTGCAVAI